jgi:chromosomal replication initiator protein
MKEVQLHQIAESVCGEFEVSREQLFGKRGTSEVAEARQAAYYVARRITKLGFVELGAFFGRNHSTVSHGFQKVHSLTRTSCQYSDKVKRVMRSCRGEAR